MTSKVFPEDRIEPKSTTINHNSHVDELQSIKFTMLFIGFVLVVICVTLLFNSFKLFVNQLKERHSSGHVEHYMVYNADGEEISAQLL